MHNVIKFILFAIFVSITSCSTKENEFEWPFADIDDATFNSIVDSDGGQISVSFTVNTSWVIKGPKDVVISPDSGSEGNNTVVISLPMNESSKDYRTYYFDICTSNGDEITEFSLYQKPAPYINCEDELMIEQDGHRKSMVIKSNEKPTVSSEASWIILSIEDPNQSDETYNLNVEATENSEIEERNAVVTVSIGKRQKKIMIRQKGGILLKYDLFDNQGKKLTKLTEWSGSRNYSILPTGGQYTLKVTANSPWTLEKLAAWWPKNFGLKLNSKDGNSAVYSIYVSELDKDAYSGSAVLIFRFKDDMKKKVRIDQDAWKLRIDVRKGEYLSSKINEVKEKLNEGYYIDEINFDGADLRFAFADLRFEKVPKTIRKITISNVENIPENFCSDFTNLKELSLSNVKRIGACAFMESGLRDIEIPASVIYIGDRAFMKYRSWYPEVRCYSSNPPTIGKYVFHNGNGNGSLRIPMGSKPKYKADRSWSGQFSEFNEF